jgi:hypothetical protein
MLHDKGSTSGAVVVLLAILTFIAVWAYSYAGWPGIVAGLVLAHIALIWLSFIAFGPFFLSFFAIFGAFIHLCIVMVFVYLIFGENFGDATGRAMGAFFRACPEIVHFKCLEPYLAEYDLCGDSGTVMMDGWNGPVNFAIYALGGALFLKFITFFGNKAA